MNAASAPRPSCETSSRTQLHDLNGERPPASTGDRSTPQPRSRREGSPMNHLRHAESPKSRSRHFLEWLRQHWPSLVNIIIRIFGG